MCEVHVVLVAVLGSLHVVGDYDCVLSFWGWLVRCWLDGDLAVAYDVVMGVVGLLCVCVCVVLVVVVVLFAFCRCLCASVT